MLQINKNFRSQLVVLVLFIASIAGLSLPFVWYELGWLSLVGLVPFLYFLRCLREKKMAIKQQLGLIWVVGLSVFLVVLSWSLQTNPEKWAFISGRQADLALGLVFLGFSLVLSLQYLIFGSLYLWIKPRFTSKTVFLIFPAIWVVAEAGRSLLFSLVVAGPGGSIGTDWNFGVLGIAGSVTPLGYLARLVGMFGMSFVVVVINLCVFWLLQKRWKLPLTIFATIMLVSLACYVAWQPPAQAQKVQVGFVQLPQSFEGYNGENNYYDEIIDKTKTFKQKTDILVLPEY
jgi:apolipoprotein N-acyltransferase